MSLLLQTYCEMSNKVCYNDGMKNDADTVYDIVSHIPKGKVATYSQIAKFAGIQNPRLVGSILHKNPDPVHIPCHRVVNIHGKLAKTFAFGGRKGQSNRLTQEGIEVIHNAVDLVKYLWRGMNALR